MNISSTIIFIFAILLTSCGVENNNNNHSNVSYNIIEPGNGIYIITEKDVSKDKLVNNSYEEVILKNDLIAEIRRFSSKNRLTDSFYVAAITRFEYDTNKRVRLLKYYDKNEQLSEDDLFGYSSIEYIYDEKNRVIMEFYRNKQNQLLEVPVDNSGNIAKRSFISPILTYEYVDDTLKIKALDKNFNLLKEIVGDKPCIPFIDCGESE